MEDYIVEPQSVKRGGPTEEHHFVESQPAKGGGEAEQVLDLTPKMSNWKDQFLFKLLEFTSGFANKEERLQKIQCRDGLERAIKRFYQDKTNAYTFSQLPLGTNAEFQIVLTKETNHIPSMAEQHEENERKARVDAVWEKMNNGVSAKVPKTLMNNSTSAGNKHTPKATPNWMASLGLAPNKTTSADHDHSAKGPASLHNGTNEDGKRLAAAALSAVKDITSAAAAGRGKVEITEVRDFAGKDIQVRKLVDADSKEAAERAKVQGAPVSALDTILEQIKKKPKLSVLDKTKKDWGEFKEENKGLEDQLDAYKKSTNQYLDRVSFLQRADLREFEREKEVRLALQAKRRADMRED